MNLQVFKSDFVEKWLTPFDKDYLKCENDKKLKAGINWIEDIHRTSFRRYDDMLNQLKSECKECVKKNCSDDYNWILSNGEIITEEDKSIKFRFTDAEIGKKGIEVVNRYKKCKIDCYEKVELFTDVMGRNYSKWNKELNLCFIICRAKPLDKNEYLPNCYTNCMIKNVYALASHEFYLKYVFENLLNEYKKNYFDRSKADVMHSYRVQLRELDEEVIKKYL